MSRILSIWERMPKDSNHRVPVKNGQQKKDSLTKDDQEKKQIRDLQRKLPSLNRLFNIHCKIGEGTFSSVFLGTLKNQYKLPDSEKRYYAIKHLVPTSHPARIEHELRCLQDMGGRENVIGVELCLRHLDTVVFVMPYIPHKKFSDYVGDMDAEEVKQYMKALLTALCHVHSFGVIHRDVKPSNFLYDRENRRYLLVDFGLAQRAVRGGSPPPAHAANAVKRRRDDDDAGPDAKRLALDLSTKTPSLTPSDSDRRAEPKTNGVHAVKQETRNAITGRAALVRALAGGGARRHRGLPAARGAAEGARADGRGGRVGGGGGAAERADGPLPAAARRVRRRRARRAARPARHRAARCRRARARSPPGDVSPAAGAVPAQAGGVAARAPARRRRARARLRRLRRAQTALRVPDRPPVGGVHCGGVRVPGRGVLAGGAAAGPGPALAALRRRRAQTPLPRRLTPSHPLMSVTHLLPKLPFECLDVHGICQFSQDVE